MTHTPQPAPAPAADGRYWASYNPVAGRWQVLGSAYTRDGMGRSISGGAHPVAVVTAAEAAHINRTGKLKETEHDGQ